MNAINEFLDTYKNGIPVTVRVESMSIVLLCAAVLVTALLVILMKKYIS